MSITSDLIRGNTDTIILSCLERGDSYGYRINKTVREIAGGEYEIKRLEESGSITSYWGEENTGARRRYYRITDRGRAVLKGLRRDWELSKNIIDKLTKEY